MARSDIENIVSIENSIGGTISTQKSESDGWIVSLPMWSILSLSETLLRLLADPNKSDSVLLVFSCKPFELHQLQTSDVHDSSRATASATLNGFAWHIPCMSSANNWCEIRWWRNTSVSQTHRLATPTTSSFFYYYYLFVQKVQIITENKHKNKNI